MISEVDPAIRNGADYLKVEAVLAAFSAINAYRSRDVECAEFLEGADGRLYHLETIHGEMVRQQYVLLEMRVRLVRMARRVRVQTQGERAKRICEFSGLNLVRPREKIVFDFMKLQLSLSGNKYLLVIVDVWSREIALETLATKKTEGVVKVIMNRAYLIWKSFRVWQSHNANELASKVMIELAKLLLVKFKRSSPYHPKTNTHVEQYNKRVATQLSLLVERADQTRLG